MERIKTGIKISPHAGLNRIAYMPLRLNRIGGHKRADRASCIHETIGGIFVVSGAGQSDDVELIDDGAAAFAFFCGRWHHHDQWGKFAYLFSNLHPYCARRLAEAAGYAKPDRLT